MGVRHAEAPFVQVVVKIDRGTLEVNHASFVNDHLNAMNIKEVVGLLVEVLVKVEFVLESAATTSLNANSEINLLGKIVIGNNPLHFVCGTFGDRDRASVRL